MFVVDPASVVLIDSEGCVVVSGDIDQVRLELKKVMNAERTRHAGRYASLQTQKPIDKVVPGDIVELRAGKGGALWDKFAVFTSAEWTHMVRAMTVASETLSSGRAIEPGSDAARMISQALQRVQQASPVATLEVLSALNSPKAGPQVMESTKTARRPSPR